VFVCDQRFVVIPPPAQKGRRRLTEHQKEVARSKKYVLPLTFACNWQALAIQLIDFVEMFSYKQYVCIIEFISRICCGDRIVDVTFYNDLDRSLDTQLHSQLTCDNTQLTWCVRYLFPLYF
jgi:hypothetical protein